MAGDQATNFEYLRIAVASDLHAYVGDLGELQKPSYLRAFPTTDKGSDPASDLIRHVEEHQIKADILISPGDIGDKAVPDAIKWGWMSLHKIGKALDAKLITAVTGNHDQDSRHTYSNYDSKETLQRLEPPYPLQNSRDNDQYFSRKFTFVSEEKYRIVLLNSSAYHGESKDEQGHGRISDFTLEQLRIELSQSTTPPVNILVCHHHPQLYPEIKARPEYPYEVMRNGERLIDLLDSGGFGDWLIIHGHRHHPRLSYAMGKTAPPVIFSAGSFSACLYPALSTQTRNQFYLVTLPLHEVKKLGLVGTVEAWDWSQGRGWQEASHEGGGLPAKSGFGARAHAKQLAQRIAKFLGASPFIEWASLSTEIQELEFLLPEMREQLKVCLESDHNLSIEMDQGKPKKIGRRGSQNG